MTRPDPTLGIYVHIPFCRSKCPYCDFYSLRADDGTKAAYVSAVCGELETLKRVGGFVPPDLQGRQVESVYFGGGTPSALAAEQLSEMLHAVRRHYRLSPDAEVTAEVNPGLRDADAFFSVLAAAGFNRASVGMQSAVDAERRRLGRTAGFADVKRTVLAAKRSGIGNLSLDLMLGVPGQTQASLSESADAALSLDITHLSAYILKLEPGTVFARRADTLGLPDEDAVCDMYLALCDRLERAGMRHYEISNFCFGGRVGRHNLRYWDGGDYLGIGPAAHSFVDGRRFFFPRSLDAFLQGEAPLDDSAGGDAEERLMLRLRLDEGLDLPAYYAEFGVRPTKGFEARCRELRAAGLLQPQETVLSLTPKGMLLSNTVITDLLIALFPEK
ncbi:MAG: radical SAM family heme chaperone HemW [Clostridia bacterium]|nr:radical SAM family heme chaperone HemW [Clostridia bacterium]